MSDLCSSCQKHCCGALAGVRPVLMPWESADKYSVVKVGDLSVIAQDDDGVCVYFDYFLWSQGKGGCLIYDLRPFECRIYPLIMDFSESQPSLKKDPRAPCDLTVWPREWLEQYKKAEY